MRQQRLTTRIAAYVACVFFSCFSSSRLAAAAELAGTGNHAVSEDFPETLHSSGASPLTLSSRARSDDFRSLALGDFDALNALYGNTSFTLPGTTVDTDVGGFTLSLSFANIVCRDFNLGDIRLTPVENITTAATTIRSTLQLVDVDIVCSADYRYRYILGTNGGGRADIYTRDNSVSSQIVLRSPDLARFAPDEFILENCATTVNVFDLDFNGGGVVNIVGNILNALDKVLRNVVEREISDFLCQALQDVDDDVAALLGRLTTLLGPYLGDSPDGNGNNSVAVGALQAERDLVVPSDVTLLNFQEPSTQFANVIDLLVEQVGGYFGNTNTGAGTLNINALLRDQILDDNGALVVDLTKLGDFGSGNLLQASNEILGSIAVKIETATVIGLDSFSRFDDLSQIGNFTFQTGFAIEDIRLEIQMELRLQPPASTQSLVEVVQVEIPLDRVDASTSLLLAIDQGRLGSLPLGSLLNDDSVVNCLLSAVFDLQVTSLSIQPALSVGLPTVRGFATPGLQRVVGTAVEIVYDAFYQTLVVALNNFVQTTAIEFLDDAVQGLRNSTTCLTKARGSETALIDFRDLLLSAEESKAYGGNGTNPYGRLASFAKDFLDNELLVNDAAGSPKVNDLVIRPLTRQQSGENGTFALEQDFFAFDDCLGFIGLDTTVHFRVADLLLENLDSIGQPLDLLTPIRDDAIRLNNTLSVGSLSAPLRASFLIDFGIQSAGTIVANKLNVGVGFRSLTAALKLLARFVERDFLSFPIEDILNVHCWLAMLQTPTLDAEGVRIEDSVLSLAIQDLILIVAEMDFVWDCLECSSPQMIEVEEFFQTPQGQEDATSIAEIAIDYLLSLTKGENSFLQSRIDRLLISSATRCPHQPEYNPLPRTLLSNALQLEDTETSACGLGEEVIDMDDTAVTDPLTAEKDLVVPSNVTLLNFEAPSTQFADTVDILIDRISGYLGNRNVEGSLNINSLLRDQILQEDGALLVDMEKLGNFGSGNLFEAGNDLVGELSIAIQTASIFGLDSFQRFDRLSQIGKYTLQANFIIEDIRLEIQTELRLQLPASSRSLVEIVRVEIPLGIVDASTSLLLAIDQGQLGSLPLGSLLHDDSVMNCLLSAVFDLHVTSLRISPGLTIGPPTVLGFVTPGLQRVINAAVDIIYDAIGGELSGSLNNFVQTTAMEFLDDAWQGLRNSTTCLTKAQGSETALIDFRDLLLSAEESEAYGGNGTNPYGSLGVVVKSLIDDELVANDASGVPKMNNFIIKPLTEQQSGIAGTFLLAQEFLAFDQRISFNGLDAKVRFRIADLRVENLDTIREPLALLDPLTNEASRINNTLSMGTPSTPLRISVLLQIGVEGAGTYL
jgi:3-deoxy-D-manno-octulosonate 8-phosphate phosphatase KdsC-like HAD superfamily phosphatase